MLKFQDALKNIKHYWSVLVSLVLLTIWCWPYFTSGQRIEWGDFSMFAQAYEAIRISVLEYKQFPWVNAWMAGGTPLYANPQIGVFSLQTLFVFIFGSALGLKIALAIYTYFGWWAMYILLHKSFKIPRHFSALLSLAWIFSSFFVAHLPSHYTFLWYMLAPLFFHLSLQLNYSIKSGLLLGAAFAVMALSQIHNPFFHISIICAGIISIKLIRNYREIKNYILPLLSAAGIFLLIAGHRLIYTAQNALEFPRTLVDTAPSIKISLLSLLLPFSSSHPLSFVNYPVVPFGWKEATAYIGLGVLASFLISIIYLIYKYTQSKSLNYPIAYIVILLSSLTLLIGLGTFTEFSPYHILKSLPVFSNMRVSSRWFIFTLLGILITTGLVYRYMPRLSFDRFLLGILVSMSIGELFVMNLGYQYDIFSHDVILAQKSTTAYQFEQSKQFGSTFNFADGKRILADDGKLPHFYREYEATTHNIGVIQANDALIDLNTLPTPRCGVEDGCNFVLTHNAKVVYWSPNKIILSRESPGPIKLNMNNSSYYKVNGIRNQSIKVAEGYTDFVITDPNTLVTIESAPSILPKIVK